MYVKVNIEQTINQHQIVLKHFIFWIWLQFPISFRWIPKKANRTSHELAHGLWLMLCMEISILVLPLLILWMNYIKRPLLYPLKLCFCSVLNKKISFQQKKKQGELVRCTCTIVLKIEWGRLVHIYSI